jgi:DNA repair ATPase RecN
MNQQDLIEKLRQPTALGHDAADEIERLNVQVESMAELTRRAGEARGALELYREGLKHGEQNYDELQQAMELLGSAPEKFRIRKRKAMSRAELILRIDGLIEDLDEIGSLVAKMASDRNATPQAQTNAKSIARLVDAAKEDVRADIEACGAAITGTPAGQSEPVTDYCTLEEGHEGDHQGKSIRWPQETAAATA